MESLQDTVLEVLSNTTNSMVQDLPCNANSLETNQEIISHLQMNFHDRIRNIRPSDLRLAGPLFPIRFLQDARSISI